MIAVSVLYPNTTGNRFDLAYYEATHLPLVRRLLAPLGMRALTFYRPVETDPDAPFRLVAELRFDDMAATQAALAAHGAETQADIANFTDEVPVILIGPLRHA
ncbi:MAG: EthD family reductase [Gemmobacter sp.]